jgi:mRNA interferase RelE/StbE
VFFFKSQLKRLINSIKNLENNPRPQGCKKLSGLSEDLWRIRVGDYRIIYSINESIKIIDIRKIGHRKNIYE